MFKSISFAGILDRPHNGLGHRFITALSSREILVSILWLRVVHMNISDRELFIDIISLDIRVYDIIPGMDFFAKYGASIVCRQHRVVFQPNGEKAFEFLGEPKKKDKVLLLVLEARKLIHGGYDVYMVHIVDTRRKNQMQLLDVPTIRDFMDVFLQDLLRLPLDCEIMFEIELTPGMGPISKVPYGMTST